MNKDVIRSHVRETKRMINRLDNEIDCLKESVIQFEEYLMDVEDDEYEEFIDRKYDYFIPKGASHG